MDAALADDAARPPGHFRAAHQPRAHADEGEGEDEADEDEEHALASWSAIWSLQKSEKIEAVRHAGTLGPRCGSRLRAVLGGDQVEGEQHRRDREERGEDDVGERLGEPVGEQRVAEQMVDADWQPGPRARRRRARPAPAPQKTIQKWPRTRCRLRRNAARTPRPSISTTGPARPKPDEDEDSRARRAATRPTATIEPRRARSTAISRP